MNKKILFSGGALKLASAILNFSVSVLLARALGAEEYGIYANFIIVSMILASLIQFGLTRVIIRELSSDKSEQFQIPYYFIRQIILIYLFFLAAGGLLFFNFHTIIIKKSAESFDIALIVFACSIIISLTQIFCAVIKSRFDIIKSELPELFIRPAIILISVLFITYLTAYNVTFYAAKYLFFGACFTAFMYASFVAYRHFTNDSYVSYKKNDLDVFYSSLRIGALLIFAQINLYADIIILGYFGEYQDVGIYRACAQSTFFINFGLTISVMIVAPSYSKYFRNNETKNLMRMANNASRLAVLFGTFFLIIFITYGREYLLFFFGEEFKSGYAVLIILACAYFAKGMFGPLGVLLNMTRNDKSSAFAHFIAAAFNIVATLILVPKYGSVGAAASTLVTFILLNFILLYYVNRNLKFVPHFLSTR